MFVLRLARSFINELFLNYLSVIEAIIFDAVMVLVLIGFFVYSKEKGREMLKIAFKSLKKGLPLIIALFIVLIFLQSVSSEEFIVNQISRTNGVGGYLTAAMLGAFVHLPLIIIFPLGSELLKSGVNYGFVAVLITSLAMVHLFSISIEAKELGLKFSILRNSLSLLAALIIGVILGVFF
jgi:uncharacterized membrane protein YraQ (UPF0718 family)